LLEDSKKVSRPSRAALQIIAVEEAAKGWMLLLAMMRAKYEAQPNTVIARTGTSMYSDFRKNFSDEEQGPLNDAFEADFEKLIHPPIEDAFERHKVKLTYVGTLVRLLAAVVPYMSKIRTPDEVIERGFKGRVHAPTSMPPEIAARLEALTARLGNLNWADLQNVKEEGLYVCLEPDGTLAAPMSRPFGVDDLETLVTYLVFAAGPMMEAMLGPDA
jgi:hypothetical protein